MIEVLTDPGVGGTFLTWSLHFLAGHKNYYHAKSNRWITVPENPLTIKNSHVFKPNQPSTLDTFNLIHSALASTPVDNFHTIYFHNFSFTTTSYDKDLATAISNLDSNQRIILTLSKNHFLYNKSYKIRSDEVESRNDPAKKISTDHEALEDFIDYFFKDSRSAWKELSLINIWDQREFLALNLMPTHNVSIIPNIDLSKKHYRLDTMELWNTFDVTVDNLFSYLGVPIIEDRRLQWNTVYNQWRRFHLNRMLFVWYFDTIIDNIKSGYDLDLMRLNLDIVQEAIIQHELIYKHNLNLKTWQLEKFTNTKQLHQLLEPNIHDLSKSKITNIEIQ